MYMHVMLILVILILSCPVVEVTSTSWGSIIEQEMTNREYLEDQDAEEPDDFIISLTAQVSIFID